MAKKEKVAAEAPEVAKVSATADAPAHVPATAEEVRASEPKAEKKAKKTSFDVHNRDGGFIRTYSVEVHGKDAEDLANEYAKKIGGSVK